MKEVLGDSYFKYLANLPDLVLLMDESHRYYSRENGVKAVKPIRAMLGSFCR